MKKIIYSQNKLLYEVLLALGVTVAFSFAIPHNKGLFFIIYLLYLIYLFVSKIPTAILFDENAITVEYFQFGKSYKKSCSNQYVHYYYGHSRIGRGSPEKALEIYFCGDKIVSFMDIFSGWSEETIIEILEILKEKKIRACLGFSA